MPYNLCIIKINAISLTSRKRNMIQNQLLNYTKIVLWFSLANLLHGKPLMRGEQKKTETKIVN